jgi:hypothetical protein
LTIRKLPTLASDIKQTWVPLEIGFIQIQDILPGLHHSALVDHSYNIFFQFMLQFEKRYPLFAFEKRFNLKNRSRIIMIR